jgi:hypothetical protein
MIKKMVPNYHLRIALSLFEKGMSKFIIDWGSNLAQKRGSKITKEDLYDSKFISSILLHLLELIEPKFGGFIDGHLLHPNNTEELDNNVALLRKNLPSAIIPHFEDCEYFI